jgi:putative FmdB family regulatory protein
MPTYEYRCPEGHEFEKFTQKISDAQGELPCPTCGKVAPRRMSAGGGLLFKGSGFYITDYGKDGKKDQRAATAKPDAAPSAASPATPAAPSAPAPAAAPVSAPKSGPDK